VMLIARRSLMYAWQHTTKNLQRSPTVLFDRRTYVDGRRRSPYGRHYGHISATWYGRVYKKKKKYRNATLRGRVLCSFVPKKVVACAPFLNLGFSVGCTGILSHIRR
jgi:hypothetical protein